MALGSSGVRIILYFHDIKVMVRAMESGLGGVCCVDNSAAVDNSATFCKMHM